MNRVALLGAGLVACVALASRAEDKPAGIEGKYTLVAGKAKGGDVTEKAKMAAYTITADKFTIKGEDGTFVMSYKLDPKAKPPAIDLEILEGPEGTKGLKAAGIYEAKGDTLKIAYAVGKADRPKSFDGKADFHYELKKAK